MDDLYYEQPRSLTETAKWDAGVKKVIDEIAYLTSEKINLEITRNEKSDLVFALEVAIEYLKKQDMKPFFLIKKFENLKERISNE